jgi:hypothetical protein
MKWLLAVLLVVQAHFAASYLVPADKRTQGEFGGLLRWIWPWSEGDRGLFGARTPPNLPLPGLWIAIAAAVLPFMAALATIGVWVPVEWWKALVVAGAGLSVVLMLGFLSPPKLVPLVLGVGLIVLALRGWLPRPAG